MKAIGQEKQAEADRKNRTSPSFLDGLQNNVSRWPGGGEVIPADYSSGANSPIADGSHTDLNSKTASDWVYDTYDRLDNGDDVSPEERAQLRSILKSAGYDVGNTEFDVSSAAGRFVYGNEANNIARIDFDARTGFYTNFRTKGDGDARYTFVTDDNGRTVVMDFDASTADRARARGYTTDQAILELTDYRLYDAVIKGMFATEGANAILIGGAARPGEGGSHGAGRGLDLWSMQGADGKTYGFSKTMNATESDLIKRFNDNLWAQRRETGLTQIIGPYRYGGVTANPESMNSLVPSVRQTPSIFANSEITKRAEIINNLLFGGPSNPNGHQTHEHLTIR